MKNVKFYAFALMALVMMGGLTSCVKSDDSSTWTATAVDFFDVSNSGQYLSTDDSHTFTCQNPDAITYSDGTYPTRIWANVTLEIDNDKDLNSAYNTSLYPLTVNSAAPAYYGVFIDKEYAPETSLQVINMDKFLSVNAHNLNCVVYGKCATTPQDGDWVMYVDRVQGGTLFVTFQSCTTAAEADQTTGYCAVSVPIAEMLALYKGEAVDNQLTININNGMATTVYSYN